MNVIIEDFTRPYNRKSKPLSKVSLLFLLLVEEATEVCQKPNIVETPRCKTARPGEQFQMVVRAEAGDPLKPWVFIFRNFFHIFSFSVITYKLPFNVIANVWSSFTNGTKVNNPSVGEVIYRYTGCVRKKLYNFQFLIADKVNKEHEEQQQHSVDQKHSRQV